MSLVKPETPRSPDCLLSMLTISETDIPSFVGGPVADRVDVRDGGDAVDAGLRRNGPAHDALDAAARQAAIAVIIDAGLIGGDNLELDRRGAAVEDQDVYAF